MLDESDDLTDYNNLQISTKVFGIELEYGIKRRQFLALIV